MTQATFDQAWGDLCYRTAIGKIGLPDDTQLPTPEDVADAMGETRMVDARAQAWDRLDALIRARMALETGLTVSEQKSVIPIPPELFRELPDGSLTGPALDMATGRLAMMTRDDFKSVHRLYQAIPNEKRGGLKHPLAALIEGWLRRCSPDDRGTAILPETLATVRPIRVTSDLLDYEDLPAHTGFQEDTQAYLPGLAPVEETLIPTLPLYYWDAAAGKRPGKGAPYDARIWLEVILLVQTRSRIGQRTLEVEFGDLVESTSSWLFPNGRYERNRYPAVEAALHRVHNLRFPWEGEDGRGGRWAAVLVRNMPRAWNAYRDKVVFEVNYPPGVNDLGPLVYKPALRVLAQQSVLRWRAELGLCYLWDRYGRRGGRYISQQNRACTAMKAAICWARTARS